MDQSPATVLVVDGDPGGRSRSTLAAVRALGSVGHRVFVAESARPTLAGASRHVWGRVPVPPADHPDFPGRVEAVAAELGTGLVLPASDPALWALRAPGHELVDKRWLWDRADVVGLPRLPTRSFPDGAGLVEAADGLPFPCVVKVARRTSTTAPGAGCLHGVDDVRPWSVVREPVVVQPWVSGRMRALFGVAWDGAVVAIGAQEYLRTWPPSCGVASAAVTVPPPDATTVERVAALLVGHRGVFQLQFVGEWLIDANPRVYGSLPLALAAGVNLPAMWCALARGATVEPSSARPGVAYRWVDGDVRAIVQAVRTGDRRAIGELRPRRGTAHSIATSSDLRPGLLRLRQLVSRPRRVDDPELPGGTGAAQALLGIDRRELQLVARAHTSGDGHVPDLITAHRRVLAHTIVRRAARDWHTRLRDDLLSPAWADDLDLHAPVDGPQPQLDGPAVVPLAPLARLLGVATGPQWLVQRGGRGLARLDLHAGDVPTALDRVLARCRRRRGGPGVREVIELRRLSANGTPLPRTRAVTAAASVEGQLGGAVLADHLPRRGRHRRPLAVPRPRRPRLRARRVRVAFSGLDGAGKTTQAERLVRSLRAAGIPVRVVRARPGTPEPLSRRGLIGRLRATVVTLGFVWRARSPMRFRRGVVVHDRHRLDAAATLEALYTSGRRTWHQRLLDLAPAPEVTVLLDVPADVAERRRPDVVSDRRALEAHQTVYTQAEERLPGVIRVDGGAPPAEIAEVVLRRILTAVAS